MDFILLRVDYTLLAFRWFQFLRENPLFTRHEPNHLGPHTRPVVLGSYWASNLVKKYIKLDITHVFPSGQQLLCRPRKYTLQHRKNIIRNLRLENSTSVSPLPQLVSLTAIVSYFVFHLQSPKILYWSTRLPKPLCPCMKNISHLSTGYVNFCRLISYSLEKSVGHSWKSLAYLHTVSPIFSSVMQL